MSSLFLKPSDPILTKKSRKVSVSKTFSKETKKNIETMLKLAYEQQKNKKRPVMVGLAAPQIGILKRIILVDTKADGKGKVGKLKIFINPEIIWQSKKTAEWYEGCYSTGRVCGIVSRPVSIKIKGFIIDPLGVLANTPPRWDLVEEEYKGYTARIFQHEIDHLNGRLFVDLIKDQNHLHWVKKSDFPLYRNKQAWKNWHKKCSFTKWHNIKSAIIK